MSYQKRIRELEAEVGRLREERDEARSLLRRIRENIWCGRIWYCSEVQGWIDAALGEEEADI